jgi:hypothetical protein
MGGLFETGLHERVMRLRGHEWLAQVTTRAKRENQPCGPSCENPPELVVRFRQPHAGPKGCDSVPGGMLTVTRGERSTKGGEDVSRVFRLKGVNSLVVSRSW